DPVKPGAPIARYGPSLPGAVDVSRDGRYVATIERGGKAAVWDTRTGRLLARSRPLGVNAALPRFVTAGSSRIVAVAGTNTSLWRVVFWDWRRPGWVQHTSWQARQVSELAVSRDGRRVAAGLDRRAVVLDAASGRQVGGTLEGADRVTAVDLSRDGQWLLSGSADGSARVWAATRRDAHAIGELLGHRGAVNDVRFHPGRAGTVVTAGNDGTARTWDLPLPTLPSGTGGSSRIVDADLSPDGRHIVTAEDDGWLRVRRADTGQPEAHDRSTGGQGACLADPCRTSVVFTPDGTEVVATPKLGTKPLVWSWRGRGAPRQLEGSDGSLTQVAVSGGGRFIAAGTVGNKVIVWDRASSRIVAQLRGKGTDTAYTVSDVAFVPGSTRIAAGVSDGTVHIWDLRHPRRPPLTLRQPIQPAAESIEPGIRTLDVTRDGRFLVAAAENRKLYVWRILDDEQPEQTISSVNSRVVDVAFSPDGSQVAAGTTDASVHVWQWRDKREIAVLHRHGDAVNAVEFAGDNTHLFSTSDDSTAAIYPCTTCKPFDQVLRDAKQREQINYPDSRPRPTLSQ
ncbi:MAG: WD40 repeat domain-containing protein, partial [Mycobacterium leprae]